MSRVHFQAGDIDLELTGAEPFVIRQLKLLSSFLGGVDGSALEDAATDAPSPAEAAAAVAPEPEPPAPDQGNGGGGPRAGDDLVTFLGSVKPAGEDRQTDAALLFAYYLQQRERMPSLKLSDLIRCCIRAGVDTRNFNRTLGQLTRRGLLETLRQGHAYRLSEQGVAAVESRIG